MNAPVTASDPGAVSMLAPETREWLAKPPLGQVREGSEAAGRGPVVGDEDPGSGRLVAEFAAADAQDVDLAVRSARSAHEDGRWAGADADHRERTMHAMADLVERDRRLFAELETLDTGKPLAEAEMSVSETVDVLRYFAGWANKTEGTVIPAPGPFFAFTTREPLGVCGAITPWNYPLPILAYKLAPALAMGNSVVAKPSELSPLTALALARTALEAGLPDGVFNVVTGGGNTGAALAAHPDLDKIAFTGSTVTGRKVAQAAAQALTRVSLELGGKSAHIVFADADLDAAVDAVMMGAWTNAGQVCIAGSRLLVERSVHDRFVERLVERTRTLVVGHGLEPGTQMGPIISARQKDRVMSLIETGRSEGAVVALGSNEVKRPGHFVEPTVFVDVRPGTAIEQEEIFGPVLAVTPFEGEEEAVALANGTKFGLAAGLWTSNVGRAHRVGQRLRAGSVWINTYAVFHHTLPFGGVKGSGFGRELGAEAVMHYSETKTTTLDRSV
ncbi:aldehyde dehydrogenase family protein [Streptomyces sp. NPDC001663]|uniref:aldehyde dehydrogenase family protein n=1 Tax=Streptomyces sp. NPDC001663 TaxID=3364597 RepID=UPI0036970240